MFLDNSDVKNGGLEIHGLRMVNHVNMLGSDPETLTEGF